MFLKVQTWQLKGYSSSTSTPCSSCGIQSKVLNTLALHQSKKKMGLLRIKTVTSEKEKKLKKTGKRLWNTKQEKNLTFSWGEEVLSCQKSLFLLFKIVDSNVLVAVPLLHGYILWCWVRKNQITLRNKQHFKFTKNSNTFHNGQIMLTCLYTFCKWRLIKHLLK